MTRLNITHVRTHLREVIEQVQAGEDIEIVQNGVSVAVITHPQRLRPRVVTLNTIKAQELAAQMAEARARLQAGEPLSPEGLSPERAEEYLQELRWHREEG
jgi:antitoxin (DNA-binding transcriptional repressor) of toxin-antitoxin stability system